VSGDYVKLFNVFIFLVLSLPSIIFLFLHWISLTFQFFIFAVSSLYYPSTSFLPLLGIINIIIIIISVLHYFRLSPLDFLHFSILSYIFNSCIIIHHHLNLHVPLSFLLDTHTLSLSSPISYFTPIPFLQFTVNCCGTVSSLLKLYATRDVYWTATGTVALRSAYKSFCFSVEKATHCKYMRPGRQQSKALSRLVIILLHWKILKSVASSNLISHVCQNTCSLQCSDVIKATKTCASTVTTPAATFLWLTFRSRIYEIRLQDRNCDKFDGKDIPPFFRRAHCLSSCRLLLTHLNTSMLIIIFYSETAFLYAVFSRRAPNESVW
jgi:hypothetical protein